MSGLDHTPYIHTWVTRVLSAVESGYVYMLTLQVGRMGEGCGGRTNTHFTLSTQVCLMEISLNWLH